LFDVTNAVIAGCPGQFSDFASQGITYLGGGSGVGAGAMGLDTQQVSPMSRALKNTEYCSIASPASSTLSEGLLVGIDGVAIAANITNSCSSSVANGFGTAAAFAVTNDGTATGGTPVTCPGCDGSNNYTFANSFDALKVLYFGLTHDNTYSCSSPVRKSLIRNWTNLFSSDCAAGDTTCSAGLTHAWRRSDLSGTTDAFVSVLNPPSGTLTNGKGAAVSVGIGTLSTVPTGAAKKSNPFCNSADATAAVATVSYGGSSDLQDLDPVRTNCVSGKDGVCENFKNFGTSGSFAGDLGVVLPILLPDATSTLASDLYPPTACSTSCVLVSPIKGNQLANYPGYTCPGGSTPIAGNCFLPFAGSAASPDPRCIAANSTKCVDLTGHPDGRQYNLATIVAATQIPSPQRGSAPFQFALDANKRILSAGGFYRIHSTTAGANYGGDPNTTGICQQNDDTSQIGCLADSDPCSVGYAGREAAKAYEGPVTDNVSVSAPLKALAVNGTPPFTPSSVSSDPDLALKNLLQPSGTTPLYPLSRRLYVATIYGFSNLLGGESELAACYGNNAIVTPIMGAHGFVAIPGGVQCLDYPETASTSTPAPNIQGAGNVALGGCGFATDTNACTASPPSITN
jgi:hypothetical protein